MLKLRKIIKGPGAIGIMSAIVLAAKKVEEKDSVLKTDELSLYSAPQHPLRHEEQEAGHVEQAMASLRTATQPYISLCQEKTQFFTEKLQTHFRTLEPGVTSTRIALTGIYGFLNNPPSEFYPSVGAIGFSGILGLYFAKGSLIKRLVFPTALMALTTSMFYPQDAATVAKSTVDHFSSWASHGRVLFEELLKEKPPAKEKPRTVEKVEKTLKTDCQNSRVDNN